MNISRRNLIKVGLGALTYYLSAPQFLLLAAGASEITPRTIGKSKILVIIQLSGGNDGLNTVIPYGIGNYYQARPSLAIKPDQVLPLTNEIGLNPNMQGLANLYKEGKLAILQAVGYENANRSHFRSIEIWQTAEPNKICNTGWLGRYLDHVNGDKSMGLFPSVNVESTLPATLAANNVMVPSVSNINDFRFKTDPRYYNDHKAQLKAFNEIYKQFDLNRPNIDLLREAGLNANEASDYLRRVVSTYKSNVKYPNGKFGSGLQFIAQMIVGGVNAKIFNVSLDGFDTHTNQLVTQNNLLKQLSAGISAFHEDLQNHQIADDVLIMTFSEFGRRVAENGGRGTDHGTAEPLFIVGNKVKGGIYGDHPSLKNLDEGDLKYKIDFRSAYASILDRWLSVDAKQILGRAYDIIPFV
jgi:uncharacterized protein (DUF1501 family)